MPRYAVIIAGGEGTRLRPLTYEVPKPLMPVKGKPIVEHILDALVHYGAKDVVLAIGYKADMIMDYFKDGSKFGINIMYSVESKTLGTGGAAKKAIEEHFKNGVNYESGIGENDVLIVNGDNLYDINLNEMYKMHKSENAIVTILAKEVEDITGYGVLTMDGNVVRKFVEKPNPANAESHIINAGIYILSAMAIEMMPDKEKFSMERDFFEDIVGREKICAYVSKGQWFPADTMERYEKAILGWKPPKY